MRAHGDRPRPSPGSCDRAFDDASMISTPASSRAKFDDAAFAMAPLDRNEALELIRRLRGQKLLNGFRGSPPVDREEIARMLMALGDIALACPRIREIDINPLIIGPEGAVAVDATIILS